jgi:hypothetical protein
MFADFFGKSFRHGLFAFLNFLLFAMVCGFVVPSGVFELQFFTEKRPKNALKKV